MIDKLKELVDQIITCIDIKDHKSAMEAIAHFTVLFEGFLQRNREYIFDREMTSLNRCLMKMTLCIEHNNVQGLKEIINSNFKTFLNDWDFDDDSLVN